MSSPAPQTRIDQFFSSRKKKPVSPSLKEEKTEKDGSPSVKGTLDTYLRNPLEVNCAVKRNLASDINVDSEAAHKPVFSLKNLECKDQPQKVENPKGIQTEACSASSSEYHGNGSVPSTCGNENVGLREFAADFLSLYCSCPTENKLKGQKRNGSPSLLDSNGKTCKKQQLALDCDKPQEHISSPTKESPEQITVCPRNSLHKTVSSHGLETGTRGFLGLRKCENTPENNLHMSCLPMNVTGACGTPKCGSRGSMVSPGDAFWNEAIQVVDGLCVPVDKWSVQVSKTYYHVKSLVQESHDNFEGNIHSGGDPKNLQLDEKKNREHDELTSAVSCSEASPLPVKHFDFSAEEKNKDACQDVEAPVHASGLVADRKGSSLSQECKALFAGEGKLSDSSQKEGHTTVYSKVNEASTPSSSLPLENSLLLRSWLPLEICGRYMIKGISKLYSWQVECLQVDGVLQGRNLVYCASTSAGKSFVAEILMLRRIISTGKMALLVLPYVSICAEKAEHLERLLEPLGKHVRSFYGNQGGATLPKDTSVAVCTIEKANSLVNRLLEEGRLSELGIIVIDELHMVADQARGYLLELLLTKLRYAVGEGSGESLSGDSSGSSGGKADTRGLQIVGMSATMPNVVAVADWLQAALYQTEFRPVPLEEYIKVGHTIFNKQMELVRTLPKCSNLGGKDPDHVVELCNEVVQEGHSVLLFCSSRKGCEATARHVSKFLKKFNVMEQEGISEYNDASSAIDALRRCPAGLDPVLEETLPSGVAYHHAGLTVEEREIVETSYRRGVVRVLAATSTLAAGVNLPARRVIFRQPKIGRDFIDGTRYRQMSGRAGRTGIDTRGESILICKPEEIKKITTMLNDSCPPLQSCLSEDKNGMTHAILEVVASGIVQTAHDIHRYVRCTLLNSTKPFQDVVMSAQDSLRWLCHRKFLEWHEDTKLYSTTPLGRAAFGSSLNPEESLVVLEDLSRAREGFVLASDLHLVYIVTPINVEVEPDWELYYERFMELSALDQVVGNRVGILEPFLMCMAHGKTVNIQHKSKGFKNGLNRRYQNQKNPNVARGVTSLSDEQMLRVCKRFYVSLMLSRLVQEIPVLDVCDAFRVSRGMVQSLQENAGRFASMVSLFCERLGWHDMEGLVAKFQNRLSFGVRAEIVELTTIPYVKGSRARALYKAGLRTPLAIAEASVHDIAKALFDTSSWAEQGSAVRHTQLGIAKKIKNGARKIVLDQAEEARLAAFSAFKSLGVVVPQLSQPLLAHGSSVRHASITSYGEEALRTFSEVEPKKDSDLLVGSVGAVTTGIASFASKPGDDKSSEVGLAEADMPTDKGGGACPVRELKCNNDMDEMSLSLEKEASGCHIDERPRIQSCVDLTKCVKGSNAEKGGPVNANSVFGGFDSFLDMWSTVKEFSFDVHFSKTCDTSSTTTFEIYGLAICWESSPVYYINIPKDLMTPTQIEHSGIIIEGKGKTAGVSVSWEVVRYRWDKISKIMESVDVRKSTWNLKIQIRVLKRPCISVQRFGGFSIEKMGIGFELIENSYALPSITLKDAVDMSIVAWILWPDEESSSSQNIEKEVKRRLSSEAVAAANRDGKWRNQMRKVAHNGCCRRAVQIRALTSVFWKLLISENLIQPLIHIENPLIKVLADMENWGIGVDMEFCLRARHVLGKKLKELEKEAFRLAGMTFSLYSTPDIAHVLFNHLKLPIPEGSGKGKQHPSTDKHSLDLLRHEHSIVPVIKQHRTLSKLLNSTLGSICSKSKLSVRSQKYFIFGNWLQTSTATGRLSMEEPNLQCVEHNVDFTMHQIDLSNSSTSGGDVHHQINARDFLIPSQENWLLVGADYSQIELRLMAHFSRDSTLIELLSKPDGDVFKLIAAKWTGRLESHVTSKERDQTKKLVYGILYGMGPNTLAEQLDCTSDEAMEKIKGFKSSFPQVSSWLHDAVEFCRQKGYVETLKGRKRFLSKIKFGTSKEKAKAQRQAINSICQGSAADIIKIAMIKVHSVIAGELDISTLGTSNVQYSALRGHCHILLQVHDELLLEVAPSLVSEASLLLKTSMETAVSLLVPLHVKLKVGRTWGSLEPLKEGL